MADAPVRTDLLEPLDRLRALTPQLSLDLEVRVDVPLKLRRLLVGEVLDLRLGREPEIDADLARGRGADAVDVRQPDLEALLVGEVDSGDTCHGGLLALALLVTRVRADDEHAAMGLDYAAALTHRLHGRTNFHRAPLDAQRTRRSTAAPQVRLIVAKPL